MEGAGAGIEFGIGNLNLFGVWEGREATFSRAGESPSTAHGLGQENLGYSLFGLLAR